METIYFRLCNFIAKLGVVFACKFTNNEDAGIFAVFNFLTNLTMITNQIAHIKYL